VRNLASQLVGGLYEQTGLFEGPAVYWRDYLSYLRGEAPFRGGDMIIRPVLDPYALYREFGAAIGLEALRAAYGAHWPRAAVLGEEVWEFEDDGRIGWGSVIYDGTEQVAWLSLGIWPGAQGQKARQRICDWLRDQAFRHTPAQAVMMKVLHSNARYRVHRRATQGTNYWQLAGEILKPEPVDVYWCPKQRWLEDDLAGDYL
jgi:hypothetical protein